MPHVDFSCPQCGKRLVTSEENAGRRTKCPQCDTELTIPAGGSPPAAPGPAASDIEGLGSPPASSAGPAAPPGSQPGPPVQPFPASPPRSLPGQAVPPFPAAPLGSQPGQAVPPSSAPPGWSGYPAAHPAGSPVPPYSGHGSPAPPIQPMGPYGYPGLPIQPIKVVEVPLTVLWLFLTLNIYQLFWLWRIFRELHTRGMTATTPGKAVGFLFIPFFNFVWVFMVWGELGKAVPRAYQRVQAFPPSTGAVWAAPICLVIGVLINLATSPVPAGSIIAVIGLAVSLGSVQSWMNQLAGIEAGAPSMAGPPSPVVSPVAGAPPVGVAQNPYVSPGRIAPGGPAPIPGSGAGPSPLASPGTFPSSAPGAFTPVSPGTFPPSTPGAFPSAGPGPAAAADAGRTKTCAKCAETVQLDAKVCRFCGHEFSEEELAEAEAAAKAAVEAQQAQLAAVQTQAAAQQAEYYRQSQIRRLQGKVTLWRVFGWLCGVAAGILGGLTILGLVVGAAENGPPPEDAIPGLLCAFVIFVLLPGVISFVCFRSASGNRREIERLLSAGPSQPTF